MSIHDINFCMLQACSLCPTWSWPGATSTCSRTRWRRRWTRTASATRWQLAHRQRCYQGCYQGCLQVTIHKVLEHQQLPSETTFGCEIEIPGTDYFVRYILNGFNHHSLFLLFEHVAVSREEAQYDQHQAGAVRRRRSLGRDVMVQELRMRNISTDHLRF